jgi:3-methyladenine DNA glycosylase AlkD
VNATEVTKAIYELKNPTQASNLSWFFKTGPGQYGEGDLFLGLKVPQTRAVAKQFKDLALSEIWKLLESEFHEVRQCGLFILTEQFKKTKTRSAQKSLFDFYMKAMDAGFINNWDLVDVTAPYIGDYLVEDPKAMRLLTKLAKHPDLWHRRLGMIFTFAFQRQGELMPTIEIAELLLEDDEDLMHKAVGWTLREVGKKDIMLLRSFLREHGTRMPRTALRYAIEKFPEAERKRWLLETKVG